MSEPRERRRGDFVERFSLLILLGSFLGGFLVLIDPRLDLTIGDQLIHIGGDGFSAELRGAVVQSMLIAGLSAAVGYWLGQSATGQAAASSVTRIAEAAPTVAAAAVSASAGATTGATITTPSVDVQAGTVNVAQPDGDPPKP